MQVQLIVAGATGWQQAGTSWRSLSYATGDVFRSGREALGVGLMTGGLAAIAALYISAGLLFFWRARCRLRRRICG